MQNPKFIVSAYMYLKCYGLIDDDNRVSLVPCGQCKDDYINASPIDVSC